jgi:N12 class adenine-specific DNA methylase
LVLGEESMTGSLYDPNGQEYTVTGPSEGVQAALVAGLRLVLPEGSYQPPKTSVEEQPGGGVPGPEPIKPGDLSIEKGKVYATAADGTRVDVTPRRGGKIDMGAVKRIGGLITVRDAMRTTVAAMRDPASSDADVKRAQAALTKAYETFTKGLPNRPDTKYGDLNSPLNRRLFKTDPDVNAVMGLERLEPKATFVTNKTTGKETMRVTYEVVGLSDIFDKRTINAPVEVTHVDTAHDALQTSLGVKNTIDWPYMTRLRVGPRYTAEDVHELQEELRDQGQVFHQPDGSWATRDAYLSGDVVSKLADAEAANAESQGAFTPNVEALAAIQPAPKTIDQIDVRLGAHWVPPEFLHAFVAEELGVEPGTVKSTLDSTES